MGVPLFAGSKFLGHLGLAFTHTNPVKEQSSELLYALAQQAALAIQLTRLAEETKQAALLDERNRMAQDIHDTLAQAFGGILMQLQAADRFFSSKPGNAHNHLTIARQLAQDGLDEARRTIWLLYQDDLEYRDLSTLIPDVVTHMLTNADMQVQVEISGTPYELEPNISFRYS